MKSLTMFTVHLRITDADTNKQVPVRLRIVDSQGVYRPPLGRLASFPIGLGENVGGQVSLCGVPFSYIDGSCEIRLPAGEITLDISRGPEYSPILRKIPLAAGQISLRQSIQRWTNWADQGWYSGDLRAHALTPTAALLEASAEGLSVAHLQAREFPPTRNRPGAIQEILEFSGNQSALANAFALVQVNTLNVHPVLGTISLLHCHRPVYPLRSGEPGVNDWSIFDWCDQCHRKTGLVVWPELPRLREEAPQGEALAAMIQGKIDAFEVCTLTDTDPPSLIDYYRFLDLGLKPALVGSSGKESNTVALGAVRTYAKLLDVEPFSANAWIEAIRRRRTFITTGPLMSMKVNGHDVGSTLTLQPGERCRIEVDVQSTHPFDMIELLASGELIASKPASGNRQSAQLVTDFIPERSTWLAARCLGEERLPSGQVVFAHSSPVWLEIPATKIRVSRETVEPLLRNLETTLRWIQTSGNWESVKIQEQIREGVEVSRERLLSLPVPAVGESENPPR